MKSACAGHMCWAYCSVARCHFHTVCFEWGGVYHVCGWVGAGVSSVGVHKGRSWTASENALSLKDETRCVFSARIILLHLLTNDTRAELLLIMQQVIDGYVGRRDSLVQENSKHIVQRFYT